MKFALSLHEQCNQSSSNSLKAIAGIMGMVECLKSFMPKTHLNRNQGTGAEAEPIEISTSATLCCAKSSLFSIPAFSCLKRICHIVPSLGIFMPARHIVWTNWKFHFPVVVVFHYMKRNCVTFSRSRATKLLQHHEALDHVFQLHYMLSLQNLIISCFLSILVGIYTISDFFQVN